MSDDRDLSARPREDGSSSRVEATSLLGRLRQFRRDRHGSVLAYVGLALPVFLGATGLAIDVSLWHAHKRGLQTMADAGALAAIYESTRLETHDLTVAKSLIDAAVELEVTNNGFDAGNGDMIQINNPPTAGLYMGWPAAYEVVVRRPVPTFLAQFVYGDATQVAARAVGTVVETAGSCILALDSSMGQAMKVNNGTVNAAGCDLVVNSSDPDNALYIASNGSVEADDIYVSGGTDNKGYLSSTPHEGLAQRSDPLANLPPPSTAGCDDTDVSLNGGSHTLSPGVYCGGIMLSGGADVTLEPGTYVITDSALNEGVFATSGNATLQGDGVTFYFEGDNVAQLTGNGAVNLKAPETGIYTGMLMYGDQAAPTTTSHQVNGGGNIVFDGVMYFPTAELKYNGNGAGSSDADISAVIARELRFGGNGSLNFQIDSDATLPPALTTKLTLVE